MKKYFLKYLPIEGDIFSLPIGSPIGYNGLSRKLVADGVLSRPLLGCTTRNEYYRYVSAQPAKLFLCTKTFAGDDIVTHDGIKFVNFNKGAIGKEYGQMMKELFRVVGEISHEALSYASESKVLSVEDLEFIYEHKFFKDMDFIHLNGEWTEENEDRDKYKCVVKIKGPCGHFH